MANAQFLKDEAVSLRIMIGGWPKGGKTGAIAALLNAGYKVRVLDFEGNIDPLLQYTKPEFLKNLDIATFQDVLTSDGATAFDSDKSAKEMGYSRALQQLKDLMRTDAAWFRFINGQRLTIFQQIGRSAEFIEDRASVDIDDSIERIPAETRPILISAAQLRAQPGAFRRTGIGWLRLSKPGKTLVNGVEGALHNTDFAPALPSL